GARAGRHAAGGSRRGRGLAALRRPGPDHRAARRQSPLRARQRPGPQEMTRGRVCLGPPSVRAGLTAVATMNPARVCLRPPSVRAGPPALATMNPARVCLRPPSVRAGLTALATMNPARVCLRPPSVRAGLTALATIIAMLLPVAVWAAPAPVATIEIEGVINPVTLRLVGLAIDRAQAERAQALVILLDTPGGLERSMRAIVQRMMNAEVPVVVFVAPTGARAASAGVFITMAGHVAAMAPATNIGAASPVSVGGGADKTMMKKVENDAAAFIRTVAIERGRNADWGEKAVRQAVAVTEREALKLNVIDLIADSLPDLLGKI